MLIFSSINKNIILKNKEEMEFSPDFNKKQSFTSNVPKKKKPFQFPPLSSSVDFSKENKGEETNENNNSDENIQKVKLKRPSKEKLKEKNISHSTTNFSSSSPKNFSQLNFHNETTRSLQEIKIVEENPFEEFEEEEQKFNDYMNSEKNKSKLILNNTDLKSFIEQPFQIEPLSFRNNYEDSQKIAVFYVKFQKLIFLE